ncbi:MAG TPA: S8 family serine peptidase [Bacteroidales bacterium]|nr:S8 family serine peptidase [Bacteroidales bacterium]
MKNLVIIFLFTWIAFSGFSQVIEKGIYVVTFSDKGPVNKNHMLVPADVLSDKAVARRLRQNIPLNESDLPVYAPYIDNLISNGAEVLTRSRWLNCVVVETDEQIAGNLEKIAGIAEIKKIGTRDENVVTAVNRKLETELKEYTDPQAFKSMTASNSIDYGASAGQINMLKGEYLHNLNYLGQGITIAVLDNGFSKVDVLPAFDSLWANNQVLGTKDFVIPGASVFDPSGGIHGTMVLSTMAANLPGIMVGTAPKADYWLIHTEDNAGEAVIEEYYWVSGAEFADSVGADVINSSLGYTTFINSPEYDHTYADMDGNTCVSTIGADIAASKGILVVNSAGNSGGNSWFYIGAPADGDSVFTIGAVTASGIVTNFSSRGPTYDGRIKPDIVAQGQRDAVYSWNASAPNGAVFYGDGTSFSSPIIAGMSACLWQAAPDKNNMELIESIRNTANNALEPDSVTGWGIPDFEAAHQSLTAGIEEAVVKSKLLVYPNPFSQSLSMITPSGISGDINIDFIAPDGRTILQENMQISRPTNEIYLDGLDQFPGGLYFVIVRTGNAIYSAPCLKL